MAHPRSHDTSLSVGIRTDVSLSLGLRHRAWPLSTGAWARAQKLSWPSVLTLMPPVKIGTLEISKGRQKQDPVWRCTSLIPAFARPRQAELCEFEARPEEQLLSGQPISEKGGKEGGEDREREGRRRIANSRTQGTP